jgi:hypothetical protein
MLQTTQHHFMKSQTQSDFNLLPEHKQGEEIG